VLTILLTPIAIWLGDNAVERGLLIGSCFIVLITELLNTGIEALTDRVGVEQNELSGMAKDLGSAAVFISLLLVGLVWLLIAFD
jgi:diacylglycerol kinase (ATP)